MEKIKGQKLDNLNLKLEILKKHFSDNFIRPELFQAFMDADTPTEMQQAVINMFNEKISSVRISTNPINMGIDEAKKEMVDLKEILKHTNR